MWKILTIAVTALAGIALTLTGVFVATTPTAQSQAEHRAAAFGLTIVWTATPPCGGPALGCWYPRTSDRIYIDPNQKHLDNEVDYFLAYALIHRAGIDSTNCQTLAAARTLGSTETAC